MNEQPELFPLASLEKPKPVEPADYSKLDPKILIGTSGYSFPDWTGPFYPPGTRSGDYLDFYSRHFNAVEVNSTFYGIPSPRVIELMERKTPPGFHFVVKVNRAMTHESSRDPAIYRQFLAVLEPLKAAGKYDGLLAQFPWAFKRTESALDHVQALRELLPGEPLFVEFRHDSWMTPDLEPWLRERSLGYCAVDEPHLPGLIPPVTMVTAEDAYVRMHGRNSATWWNGEGSLRYDYDYKERELREWMTRVRQLAERARRTYLFFNNCHAGQAARNAKLMQELMRQQNLAP
jgi:uncharacterized protein YecE (DUF72 family)